MQNFLKAFMLASSYLVTLVTSNSQLNFLCEIPHFEPHLAITHGYSECAKRIWKRSGYSAVTGYGNILLFYRHYSSGCTQSRVARPLFSIFLWGGGKRVWTSSQVALVLTLLHGTGSVNKRNVMHTHLVAESACCYKRITCMDKWIR